VHHLGLLVARLLNLERFLQPDTDTDELDKRLAPHSLKLTMHRAEDPLA
jgi:hypothetical protein